MDDGNSTPPQADVSPEDLSFFYLLGLSVSIWQQVESQLLTLAASSVGAINSNAFSSMFFLSGMFGQKLKMTSAAVEHSPAANNLKARWLSLEKRLKSASGSRNALVHGIVYKEQDGTHFIGGDVMNPRNFAKHNNPFGPTRRAQDLEGFVQTCAVLHGDLRAFTADFVLYMDYREEEGYRGRFGPTQVSPPRTDQSGREIRTAIMEILKNGPASVVDIPEPISAPAPPVGGNWVLPPFAEMKDYEVEISIAVTHVRGRYNLGT